MIKKMNDKQKWAIVILIGCITALLTALIEEDWDDVIDITFVYGESGVGINWMGCLLVGASFSSITGFFLFKDK